MSDVRLPITKNQADAIRAEITEINQLIQVLQVKRAAYKRLTEMIARDLDLDPANFEDAEVDDKGGKLVMVLRPKQGLVNGAAQADPPAENTVTQ